MGSFPNSDVVFLFNVLVVFVCVLISGWLWFGVQSLRVTSVMKFVQCLVVVQIYIYSTTVL